MAASWLCDTASVCVTVRSLPDRRAFLTVEAENSAMWTQAAAVAVGTALTAAGAWAGTPADDEPRPVLAVSLINFAHVPAQVLARAAEDAAAIFDLAGVSLVWHATKSPMPEPPADGYWVRVVLYAGWRSESLRAAAHVAPSTMGFAPCAGATATPCTIAYLFYDRIEDFARGASLPVGRLLGLAIAHEIGHLLLPRKSHSDAGIMRYRLDLSRALLPQFTAPQADIIRARLDQNK